MYSKEQMRRLRVLGLAGENGGDLRSLVERQGILLGKLIGEVGSGNVLYGIEDPTLDTDISTHAAIVAAHHAKYTNAAAIAAVEGEATLDLIDAVSALSLALGSTPATTGAIRLSNLDIIEARNAANSGDLVLLLLNAIDKLELGAGSDGLVVKDQLEMAKTTRTIDANDEITVPGTSWVFLSSAGATDTLISIQTGHASTEGMLLFLTPAPGKDITLKHNGTVTGSGKKLMINGEADVTLDEDHDLAIAILDNTAGYFKVMVPGGGAHGPSQHTEGNNWKLLYLNGSGDETELSLGADGQKLTATGASSAPAFEDDLESVNFIIDGGGSAITTGVKGDLIVDFACTIQSVTMLADQSGSIVVDIWKDNYASFPPVDGDSITSSAVPTITTATKSQDSTLTGWTTSIAAGDILRYNVDSITSIQRLTITLKVKRKPEVANL